MEKINPCPFCHGKARVSIHQMDYYGQNYVGDKWIKFGAQVICNKCKARGTLYTAEAKFNKDRPAIFEQLSKKAINAWNGGIAETNKDKLHMMSSMELADFILDAARGGFCPHPNEGFSACEPYRNCLECVAAWLDRKADT